MLSISELRRWCLAKTRRGLRKYPGPHKRDFHTAAFYRALGLDHWKFHGWMHGKRELPARAQREMSNLVERLDNGYAEFRREGNAPARLVHLRVPKPAKTRLAVDIGPGGVRLQLLGRRPMPERMPAFPDVAGVFTRGVEK